jgi:hypothetical protein
LKARIGNSSAHLAELTFTARSGPGSKGNGRAE